MLIDDDARDAAVAREQATDAKALIDSHIAVASGDRANMRAEQRRLDERCDGHDLDLAQAVSQQRADWPSSTSAATPSAPNALTAIAALTSCAQNTTSSARPCSTSRTT